MKTKLIMFWVIGAALLHCLVGNADAAQAIPLMVLENGQIKLPAFWTNENNKTEIRAIAGTGGSGDGSVTSIGISSSSLSVTGSPITNHGTITIDWPYMPLESNANSQAWGLVSPSDYLTITDYLWGPIATNALSGKLESNTFYNFTLTLGSASTHATTDYMATNATLTLWQSHFPQDFQATNVNLTLWSGHTPSEYFTQTSFNTFSNLLTGSAFLPMTTWQATNANLSLWQGYTPSQFTLLSTFQTYTNLGFLLVTDFQTYTNNNFLLKATYNAAWGAIGTNALSGLLNSNLFRSGFWDTLGTAAFQPVTAFQPATANGTNWANISTNVLTGKMDTNNFAALWGTLGPAAFAALTAFQPANTTLSNLANTGAVTNENSPYLSIASGILSFDDTAFATSASTNNFQPSSQIVSNLAANPRTDYTNRFVPGSNITLTTNAGGVVTIDTTAGASQTNQTVPLFFPLQIQSAWRPATNMATLEAGYQAWELQFARTNAAGANVTLSASWNFMVATNYLTNTFKLRLWVMNQSTNGPNASNSIWQAAVLRAGPSATTDWRVGAFGSTVSATNTVAASYNGTNQVTSVVIDFGTASLLAPGDACVVKLNRDNVNDTYVGVMSVVAAAFEYSTR